MISSIRHHGARGFTLIELSVVLIIIGLLVGGVVVGRSIVRSGQVQSIITDEAKYVEAAKQFKEKYGYLPGDFPNATNYWGTDPNGCPDFTTPTLVPKTTTCNGNGDGHIDAEGDATGGTAQYFETWRAWQQLADAGYIEGAYAGQPAASCGLQDAPGQNEPSTKVPGGGFEWNMFASSVDPYTPAWYPGIKYFTQYLIIGIPSRDCNINAMEILTSTEALSLDSKIDDGMPSTGNWIGGGRSGWCQSSATPPVYSIASGSWSNGSFSPTTYTCSFAVEVDW